MKKNKKWLSVLLAVCMVLTTLVPAFAAFAADDPAVKSFEDLVNGNSAWNDEMKSAYDALSGDQKNAVDPVLTGKAMKYAMDYAKKQTAGNTYQEAYPKAFTEVMALTPEIMKSATTYALACGYPIDIESLQIGDKTYSKDVLMKFTSFKFNAEITVGETQVTVEDQKAIFDYVVGEFNKLTANQQDLWGVLYATKEYKTGYRKFPPHTPKR